MTTATVTAAALPYPEAFKERWESFHSWIKTPRNRALFEAAWLTPDSDLKAVCDCFEWAGESWDRECGEIEQLVWDAFIEGEHSDYGEKVKTMSVIAGFFRPGDVTEDGAELINPEEVSR